MEGIPFNPQAGYTLSTITEADCQKIHQATLDVFQEVGVGVFSEKAMEIFADHGADVDRSHNVVKIPQTLVEKALASVPSQVTLCARDPENDFVMGNDHFTLSNFGEGVFVRDPYTGERRKSLKIDNDRAIRVLDALNNIGVVKRPLICHDVPTVTKDLHSAQSVFLNTSKHFSVSSSSPYITGILADMLELLNGDKKELLKRPLCTLSICPVSPLQLTEHNCDITISGAQYGFVLNICPMDMAGGTSPVHLAGTMVQHNAEVLSAVILSQLVRPGTPVLYGSTSTNLDLRTGGTTVGSPEFVLLNTGLIQLARWYNIPSRMAGAYVDSKVPDAQFGIEAALSTALVGLGGANLLHGIGTLESLMLLDYGVLVIDNEIAEMIKVIMKGIEVNDTTLSLDIIKDVGIRGNYLSHQSTGKHARSFMQPQLMNRQHFDLWEKAGGRDLHAVALETAVDIIENHQVLPLDDGVEKAMDEIIAKAEKELGVK